MTKIIEKGKISVGTKLITQGAVLVNCEQGMSPLEVSLMLPFHKLNTFYLVFYVQH